MGGWITSSSRWGACIVGDCEVQEVECSIAYACVLPAGSALNSIFIWRHSVGSLRGLVFFGLRLAGTLDSIRYHQELS